MSVCVDVLRNYKIIYLSNLRKKILICSVKKNIYIFFCIQNLFCVEKRNRTVIGIGGIVKHM